MLSLTFTQKTTVESHLEIQTFEFFKSLHLLHFSPPSKRLSSFCLDIITVYLDIMPLRLLSLHVLLSLLLLSLSPIYAMPVGVIRQR